MADTPTRAFQASYREISSDSLTGRRPMADVFEVLEGNGGFGRFQWLILLILGSTVAQIGIEACWTPFLLDHAEKELCLDASRKEWLAIIGYVGMMIGSILFGAFGDQFGRRKAAMIGLSIFSASTMIGAFMPNFSMFLISRLICGIGSGGAIANVVVHYSEVLPKKIRGRHLTILLLFEMLGCVYAAGLGWLILSRDNVFGVSHGVLFRNWRIFLLLCGIPCMLSLIGLICMPESPRFAHEIGSHDEAQEILMKILKWNRVSIVQQSYEVPNVVSEKETESTAHDSSQERRPRGSFLVEAVRRLSRLFSYPVTKQTFLLCLVWAALSFGYMGMSTWFPGSLDRIDEERYLSWGVTVTSRLFNRETFFGKIENSHYVNSTFHRVTFKEVSLKQVSFTNCRFISCLFEEVTAVRTYFLRSSLDNCKFVQTDFWPFKFVQTRLTNTSFVKMRDSECQVDFKFDYSEKDTVIQRFLAEFAVLPGYILTALLIDHFGRINLLALSCFAAALAVFFVLLKSTETLLVAVYCIFNCLVVFGLSCLRVTSVESYPTDLRATAFGWLSAVGYLTTIFGIVAYSRLVYDIKAISVLLTAGAMVVSGCISTQLTENRDVSL